MGNDPIECFNKQECIYKECGMFSEELDLCKLEYLKNSPKKATKREPVKDQPQREERVTNIGELQEGNQSTKEHKIIIEGEVLYNPEVKTTSSGKLVSSLVIQDETGKVRLTWWEDDTKTPMKYREGDKLRLENIWKIDTPWEGMAQGSPGKWCKVTKL